MEQAATKALELVERGVAILGQYGPEVWEKMVSYHLTLTIADYAVMVAGLITFSLGLRYFVGVIRKGLAIEADNNAKHNAEAPYYFAGGIGSIVFGLGTVIFLVETIIDFASTLATWYAPDISLLLSLAGKAAK